MLNVKAVRDEFMAKTMGRAYARTVDNEEAAARAGQLIFETDVNVIYRAMDVVAEMPDGSQILDVPCGGGVTLKRLRQEQQVRYVACDISPIMMDGARRIAREAGLSIEFVEGDVENLPFGNAEFDLCVTFNGLHCFPHPPVAIAELARCLKPGGRLVGNFAARGQSWRTDTWSAFARLTGGFGPSGTIEDLRRWLGDAGLTIDEIECSGGMVIFRATRPKP
ncbi:class I SAM-dependent methyltransferase [Nocardia sp. NPDC004654]|uniref:class I SAM-dependent methyltransferase n=1 Tax=Nocardia sp. NPDC004654 TaxID=3154776 RepID=UPI00339DCE92